MKKRILGLMLALCLCLTLLPSVALADGLEPITYLDPTKPAEQQTQTCNSYILVTEYTDDWDEGWYVVQRDVTIEDEVDLSNDTCLILCDGATLTVTEGINDENGCLTIYGQAKGTGKLTVYGGEEDNTLFGIYCEQLTVNGGTVEATGGNVTRADRYNNYKSSCGIFCLEKLYVNGGKIIARGGNVGSTGNSVCGDSYGIYIYDFDPPYSDDTYAYLTGGEIEATGGNIIGDKGETKQFLGDSCGFYISAAYTARATMCVTGGKLTATGGTVTVSGCSVDEDIDYPISCGSQGLCALGELTVENGEIHATSNDVSMTRTRGSTSWDSAESIAMRIGEMSLSGGKIELNHGTSTLSYTQQLPEGSEKGPALAYDLYAGDMLLFSGGTMRLKESFLGFVETGSSNVTLADLLADGYAYWQPDEESEETGTGSFVASPAQIESLYDVYIKPITSSGESEDKTDENRDLAWLTPVIGVLDKEPFDDVKSGDWFYDDVQYAYETGLMTGTGTRTFSPNAAVTRGMVMTILARREGIMTDRYSPWYAAGVEWAVANGISDGTNSEAEITREELATMLYRYAKLRGYDLSDAALGSFSDANSVSNYAVSATQWAVGSGLMNGSNGRLTPRDTATRAQLAAMLHRFFG